LRYVEPLLNNSVAQGKRPALRRSTSEMRPRRVHRPGIAPHFRHSAGEVERSGEMLLAQQVVDLRACSSPTSETTPKLAGWPTSFF